MVKQKEEQDKIDNSIDLTEDEIAEKELLLTQVCVKVLVVGV